MLGYQIEEMAAEIKKQKGYFEGKLSHLEEERTRFRNIMDDLRKAVARLEIDNETYEKQVRNYKEEVRGLEHQKSVLDEKLTMTQTEFQELRTHNFVVREMSAERSSEVKRDNTEKTRTAGNLPSLYKSLLANGQSLKVLSATTKGQVSKESSSVTSLNPTHQLREKPKTPPLFSSPRAKQQGKAVKLVNLTDARVTTKDKSIGNKRPFNAQRTVAKDYGFELRTKKRVDERTLSNKTRIMASRDLNNKRFIAEASGGLVKSSEQNKKRTRFV